MTRLKMDAAELIRNQQKNIDWLATPRPRGGLILPKGFLEGVRAEAIKEFAERLKAKVSKQRSMDFEDVDEVLNEMVGAVNEG